MATEITEAVVMNGKTVRVGDRVKHYRQRFGYNIGTATVIGFKNVGAALEGEQASFSDQPWIKVLVKQDADAKSHGAEWDWDRTELVER